MSDATTRLTYSKRVSQPGTPAGTQNIAICWNGDGVTAIYGNGPFEIWFLYEGGPATEFFYSIDSGTGQPMSPGVYPSLSAQSNIQFWYQVNSPEPIKLVWIFLSGC